MVADTTEPQRKRRLRAPNETVREKAEKAQDVLSQPKRRGAVGSTLHGFFYPFRVFGWLAHQPPLKQLGHGLRWFFSLRVMRFLGKVLGITYLYTSWKELKLVTWPTAKQSRQLTVAVIIFSVIFGSLIAIVDYGLDKLFKQVILKG